MRPILASLMLDCNRWTPYKDPAIDLIDLLPKIKDAGFNQVEVWQWHVTTRSVAAVRAMKAAGDELGMSFPYIGVYPRFVLDGLEGREQARLQADVLDKAEILDTPMLKIMLGVGLKGGDATPEQVQRTVERFGAWYREAKSRGIGMCVELHGGTMFDPTDVGERFMRDNPDLDFSICFQPMDFTDTDAAMALADRFAGRISHIHLQAPQRINDGGRYDYLEMGKLDYRRLLPHILHQNPPATMTLEFVKHTIQKECPFNIDLVLESARRDADFVESIVNVPV